LRCLAFKRTIITDSRESNTHDQGSRDHRLSATSGTAWPPK
jgi:hypothetical protein